MRKRWEREGGWEGKRRWVGKEKGKRRGWEREREDEGVGKRRGGKEKGWEREREDEGGVDDEALAQCCARR